MPTVQEVLQADWQETWQSRHLARAESGRSHPVATRTRCRLTAAGRRSEAKRVVKMASPFVAPGEFTGPSGFPPRVRAEPRP